MQISRAFETAPLCCTANLDATAKMSIKSMGFGYLRQFDVHPK